jgi:hypothetical protein
MTPSQLPRHPCVKLACMGLFDEAFDVSLLQFASSAIWFAAALVRLRCPGRDKVRAISQRNVIHEVNIRHLAPSLCTKRGLIHVRKCELRKDFSLFLSTGFRR